MVGGRLAGENDYPFMANLVLDMKHITTLLGEDDGYGANFADPEIETETLEFPCSGTVISEDEILTAAHCAYHTDTELKGTNREEKLSTWDFVDTKTYF